MDGLKSLRENREFACSPAGTAKDSVMSAVPPGLFVLRIPPQDYVSQALTRLEVFFSKLPQNRHPEAERLTDLSRDTALNGAESKDPRTLILPMPFGAFQPPKRQRSDRATVFPWGREQELLASCHVR